MDGLLKAVSEASLALSPTLLMPLVLLGIWQLPSHSSQVLIQAIG
jgi:hypothetical protein